MSNFNQVPAMLLAEALGYSAQLLLDDIVNIANDAVQDGVNGMESFLQTWADGRVERTGGDWDSTHQVEQGLVAFQTLLEYHTDLAFDFFEIWSLRNIFVIPPELPVVLPHHNGLDLTHTRETVQDLLTRVEELRQKIENQERMRRILSRAVHVSAAQHRRAGSRLQRLQFLENASLESISGLSGQVEGMYETVSGLPSLDRATVAELSQYQMSEPGKRQWETSKTGYLKWAVGQLIGRIRAEGESSAVVSEIEQQAASIGSADDLQKAAEG